MFLVTLGVVFSSCAVSGKKSKVVYLKFCIGVFDRTLSIHRYHDDPLKAPPTYSYWCKELHFFFVTRHIV